MGNSILLLLLAGLLTSSFCGWSRVKVIDEVSEVLADPKDTYLDDDNNINVIYNQNYNVLSYVKLNSTLDIILHLNFTLDESIKSFLLGRVRGFGVHRIITIDFTYQNNSRDVGYMESFDNGLTWTNLTLVPRDNYDDGATREYSNIIYVRETGRICIIYAVIFGYTKSLLGLVTRPSGSKVFSNEETFLEGKLYFTLSGAYTHNTATRETVFHLFVGIINNNTYELVYTQSKDSGVKWSPFKRIDGFYSNQNLVAAALGNYVAIVYGTQAIWVKYSTNGGQSWSTRKEIKGNGRYNPYAYRYYAAAFSRKSNEPDLLYYFVRTASNNVAFGGFNLTTSKYQEISTPFYDASWQSSGLVVSTIKEKDFMVAVTGSYENRAGKVLVASYAEAREEKEKEFSMLE